jgi:hypothetical protein
MKHIILSAILLAAPINASDRVSREQTVNGVSILTVRTSDRLVVFANTQRCEIEGFNVLLRLTDPAAASGFKTISKSEPRYRCQRTPTMFQFFLGNSDVIHINVQEMVVVNNSVVSGF